MADWISLEDAPLEPEMLCLLCGAKIPPLTGGSDTRILAVDGVGFAACAGHFPPDGASEAEYQAAYERIINAALKSMEIELPGASLFASDSGFASDAGLFTVAPDAGPGHGDS